VRIEDIDPPREVPGATAEQLATLARFGLHSDEPIMQQSERSAAYATALAALAAGRHLYACLCSRREIEGAARVAGVYPGICRERGLALDTPGAALRLRVAPRTVCVDDRAAGRFCQALDRDVGDFVVRRADGLWAYQLAVVVDDAAQGVTDVVRGADLLDNTPRQRWLQMLLGLPQPRTLHVPIVLNECGEKLSKQTGARALDPDDPLSELEAAGQHLGFAPLGADSIDAFLRAATDAWRARWSMTGRPVLHSARQSPARVNR